jgi:hypothetical protein
MDASKLTVGTHQANVCVGSNDPVRSLVAVPVTPEGDRGCYSYSDAHSISNTDTNSYGYTDTHSHTHSDRNSTSYADTNANSDSHAGADTCRDTECDPATSADSGA